MILLEFHRPWKSSFNIIRDSAIRRFRHTTGWCSFESAAEGQIRGVKKVMGLSIGHYKSILCRWVILDKK